MKYKIAKKNNAQEIIDSLVLSDDFNSRTENRIYTLLIKGLIVYLITTGMIGGALTATNTYFNQIIFNIVIAILSIILGLSYYNKKTENIGNLLYLLVIIIVGIFWGAYVNSGFYTWMNDIIGVASVYFNLNDIGGYNQIISDPALTVTLASCYLGAIIAIIVNISIMKKMMYADLLLDSVFILILPLYFELEPNYIYFIFLICGIIIASIWKNTGKYEKTNNNNAFIKSKKEIGYTYNYKAHLFSFIQICLPIIVLMLFLYLIIPKETYSLINGRSSLKNKSDDFVETLISSGISGFFNRYENVAGMNSGKLGGVNSIRLDYKTDINITYAPSNYNPIYLYTFIGGDYITYSNYWNRATNDMLNRNEFKLLEEQYINSNNYSGKSSVIIKNIDAETGEYGLYYSDKTKNIKRNDSIKKDFYVYNDYLFGYNDITLTPEEYEYWTKISKDNIPSLEKTLKIINIPDSADALTKAEYIKRYFYDNIPYTLRAGKTPRRKDFVNYFLDSQKKGYCIHFASSGVLLLRYLGIPARYVEGYVYDYSDTSLITKSDKYKYDDFYDGYSELQNVGVISVDITDAFAHAWIEIYVEGIGWIPFEMTPPSSDTDMRTPDTLFNRLVNALNFNSSQNGDTTVVNRTRIQLDTSKRIIFLVFLFIITVTIAPFIVKFIHNIIIYNRSDLSTKLTIRYGYFLKHISRRNEIINSKYNYRDQLLSTNYDNIDEVIKLIKILEKAGFSNESIDIIEFKYCINMFKKIKK